MGSVMAYYRDEDAGRPRKSYPTNRDDDRREGDRPYRPRNSDGYRGRDDRRGGYRNDRNGGYRDDRRGGFRPRNGGDRRGHDDRREGRQQRSDRPWIDVVALEARVRVLEKAAGIESPAAPEQPGQKEDASAALLLDAVKEFYAAVKSGEMDADMAEAIVDSLEENGIRVREETASEDDDEEVEETDLDDEDSERVRENRGGSGPLSFF